MDFRDAAGGRLHLRRGYGMLELEMDSGGFPSGQGGAVCEDGMGIKRSVRMEVCDKSSVNPQGKAAVPFTRHRNTEE